MADNETVAVELYYDGAWHDLVIADEVFTAPIVIQRGQGDESKAPRPCQITMQLDNRTDKFRPSNPMSPLYGKAGRNTPLRVKVDGDVRGIAEASSWECDQSRDFREYPRRGRKWTDVTAGGVLQRINGWTTPLRSPFRYYNDTMASVVGYWPMEDAKGAPRLSTSTPGAVGGVVKNLAFESQYRPPGSLPLADVNAVAGGTTSTFAPSTSASTDGWQVSWTQKLSSFDAADTYTFMFLTTDDGSSWTVLYSAGSWIVLGPNGFSKVVATTLDLGAEGWMLFTLDTAYSAGTTTVTLRFNGQYDGLGWTGFSDTYSGSPGRLKTWMVTGLTLTDFTIGHVIGVQVPDGSLDLMAADRQSAWLGYADERASVRFGRQCDQFGIPYYVGGAWATSALMGPQQPTTLAEQFEEIATTDDGIVYDYRTELRLYYRSRQDRYRQTAVTIYPEDLPWQPKEAFDNQGAHNIVTVAQVLGAEYTATDSTSAMGTQDPPNGIGEARDTVDVNMYDETAQGPQEANWWLRRGTVDLPRFPQVTVNLGALDASRRAVIEAIDVGDVIEIPRLRENTIRLYVLGYTETIRPGADGGIRRTIVFTCRPDQQFQVGRYDATDNRWDLRTCSITGADRSATTTTITVTITADEAWSSTSAFDIIIAGEVIGVPAGGAAARTGTPGAYSQTLSGLVRSKNGVLKTLPSGSEVHVYNGPGRWAL